MHAAAAVRATHIFHSARLGQRLSDAMAITSEDADAATTGLWAGALLSDALRARASDIHLDPQRETVRIRFRIDGAINDVASLRMTEGERLLRYFKTNSDLDPAPGILPADAHVQFEVEDRKVDVRVACAPCFFGEKVTLRLLPRAQVLLRLSDLGLADEDRQRIERWLGDISGMFLVTGPIGSGKTTTLYALLAELDLVQHSVLTIEDPIEYQMQGINQMQVDEKRGFTFAEGLKAALRHDPDFILVGEVRDAASAATALEAAGTGRVVLSTMHSRDVAGAVTALRNFGLGNHEIATALAYVVAQRLVRKLCPECSRREKPTESEARWLRGLGEQVPENVWHATGCARCGESGYIGRSGIYEVSPADAEFYDLVLSGADEHAVRRHLRERGSNSLLQQGLARVRDGLTDLAELRTMGAQTFLERVAAPPEGR